MAGSEGRGLSIFNRLLIAFLGVVFASFCLMGVVYYRYSRKSLEEQARERILQQFACVVAQFRHEVAEDLSRDLRILESSPVLDEFTMSSDITRDINARALERQFLQSIKNTPGIIGVSYLDSSGREQVRVDRTGRVRERRDLGGSEAFARIENGPPGGIHSDGLFRTADGEVFFSIGIGKSDVDIGKFGGAITIDYSLEAFLRKLQTIRFFGETPIWVFATNGQVLQRPVMKNALDPRGFFQREPRAEPSYMVSKAGAFIYQDLSITPGRPLLRVAISVPYALLLRDLRAIMGYLAVAFAFSLAVLSATAYLLAGYLSRPIAELAAAATRLARGDLSAQVRVQTTGEVKMLVDSFNLLVKDLQATMVSKDYLDNIIASMIDTLVVVSRDGRITRLNAAACVLLGYQESELLGQPLATILQGASQDTGAGLADQVAGGPVGNVEKVYVTKDGTGVPVMFSASALRAGDGGTLGVVCVAQDITRRKLAEKQLQTERNRAQKYLDVAGALLVVIDSEERIRLVNRKGCEILGWREAEIVGRNWFDAFVPERLRDEYKTAFHDLLNSSTTVAEDVESLVVTSTGEEKIISWHNTVLKDEDGSVISLGSGEDVTERRKLETQLRQAQKMETVGTLAGGVAHDFNNILTAILGFAELLQLKLRHDETLYEYLEHIVASAKRGADLTHGLLAFSRKQVIDPKPVDVNQIVRKLEKFLSRLITEDIQMSSDLFSQPLVVIADTTQIEQILINLSTNARDAMPEGGTLTIATDIAEITRDFIAAHGYGKRGVYAMITVSDNGHGMDENTRARIFEPFFTTKQVGQGTGLGLSIVYGIVKQHDGYINCYSEPGQGTIFNVYLPLTRSETLRLEDAVPAAVRGGTETVLVAEDSDPVRIFTVESLTQYGYRVLAAADGEEALRVYRENAGRVDLLLLDVIMPGKNGRELYDAVRATDPRIKCLFTSGYTADIIHKKGIVEEGFNFILKPVSLPMLLTRVREVLDGDAPSGK